MSAGSSLNSWVSPPAPISCSVVPPVVDPKAKCLELDDRIRVLEGRPSGRDVSSDHALAARLAATESVVADLRMDSTTAKESRSELAARLVDLEKSVTMMMKETKNYMEDWEKEAVQTNWRHYNFKLANKYMDILRNLFHYLGSFIKNI